MTSTPDLDRPALTLPALSLSELDYELRLLEQDFSGRTPQLAAQPVVQAGPVEALMPAAAEEPTPGAYLQAIGMVIAAFGVLALYIGVPLLATMVHLFDSIDGALAACALAAAGFSGIVVVILRATLSRIRPYRAQHVALPGEQTSA